MATVLITGGTGMIGKALTKILLDKQYKVIVVSRKSAKANTPGLSYAQWDIEAATIDRQAIAEADYIVHLAGAGIADKRWSDKRKEEIVSSRVKSSALIVHSLNTIPNKVKAVISASAIGWYGADRQVPNPRPFAETDPPAKDFLGETCRQWEESITPVVQAGKRLVVIRTGIVISKEGGALKEFEKPLHFGIAAILGSGRQVISWIHVEDLAKLYLFAIENEGLEGVYNGVAPQPVSNKTFVKKLAKEKNKKFYIPVHVPSFVLKVMLGEMSIEVLKSATVSSAKIEGEGFVFAFPNIEEAFQNV